MLRLASGCCSEFMLTHGILMSMPEMSLVSCVDTKFETVVRAVLGVSSGT